MKRSRFKEEQIIGILRERRRCHGGGLPQAWDLERHVLQLEGEVRRAGRVGCQAAEGARGREVAQANVGDLALLEEAVADDV